MINLDFSWAVALSVLFPLALILPAWIYAKKHKERDLFLDSRFIWFCTICSYTYVNTKEDAISTCPRCGSYNKRQEPGG